MIYRNQIYYCEKKALIYSFIHSFVHLLIHSFICSFILSFILFVIFGKVFPSLKNLLKMSVLELCFKKVFPLSDIYHKKQTLVYLCFSEISFDNNKILCEKCDNNLLGGFDPIAKEVCIKI